MSHFDIYSLNNFLNMTLRLFSMGARFPSELNVFPESRSKLGVSEETTPISTSPYSGTHPIQKGETHMSTLGPHSVRSDLNGQWHLQMVVTIKEGERQNRIDRLAKITEGAILREFELGSR